MANETMDAVVTESDTRAELLRLQQRVVELETELEQRSWNIGEFYRMPTLSQAPAVVGQVVTLGESGKPYQVIEAAEPALMASIPMVRQLRDGLSPNVVSCTEPDWWPL